ncbi:putative cyclin-B3-1 isoform X2 [Rhodamnia argentea]|uniref:Cyclin-B3-1 isoform X2 n=1 Tax=Rhodamnia argentea TaxID=178133 RepID=A0A8B8P0E5_9MYRT|nr:putative cyclin-B3-1 isoform X2 [Rhodamnia argentea]
MKSSQRPSKAGMVIATAKVKGGLNPFTEGSSKKKNVCAGKFKVYTDAEKLRTDTAADSLKPATGISMPPRKTSMTANKGVSGTTVSDARRTAFSCVVELLHESPSFYLQDGFDNQKKSTSKNDASGKANIRRKALADVSNVRKSDVSNKVVCDGSKPMKYKNEGFTSLQRVSVDPSIRKAGVAMKKSFVVGKVREQMNQRNEGPPTVKRVNNAIDSQRVVKEGPCHDHNITEQRTRVSATLARKSLPVLRRSSQENSESAAKRIGRSAMPTKIKGGHKVLPRVSNLTSHIASTRASSRTMMGPRFQSTVGASSSKQSKGFVNNILGASNAQRASKSKDVEVVDKSGYGVSLEKQTEVSVPLTEDTFQLDKEAIPSSNIVHSGESTSGFIAKKKPQRRRSYTSLLMARSKFLGENGEVLKLEKLPSIDDYSNQLEVAEYVDDIYEYYWNTEAHSACLANYMSIQTDITPNMRGILVNWLIEVHFKFDLMHETLYLMVTLLDRYLSQVSIQKKEMQLVGLTALLLSSKYEDFWHPRIKDLISISAESYTREQMLGMEKSILKQLKFRLNLPTPYVFMLRFLKAAHSDKKLEHLAFYLIELCLVEYEALEFKSSLLCASALYVARCTLQMSPAWTPLLIRHSRYEVSQIRVCAETILRFHKAARLGQLKVTYEKYMGSELSCVAALKPLDELPF